MHGIDFEASFYFTTSWNISISILLRHDNIEKVYCKDLRMSHDDGLYWNFSPMELNEIFGYVLYEPSMDNQIKAHGTKKNSENSDIVGTYRHKQIDRCFIFSWLLLILYRIHEIENKNFNFYNNKDGKYICDVNSHV